MLTRRLLAVLALTLAGPGQASALEINWALDNNDKLAYLNLWGEIVSGDAAKFRGIVTPLVQQGYVIFKVNIYSGGGNVSEAMDIGDQIRTLNTITVSPYYESRIVNNQKVPTGRKVCSFSENNGYGITFRSVSGYQWCTCESACFLIWGSGAVRQGGVMGIHRPYWKGPQFGNQSVADAREQYARSEARYRAYLQKLNVPATIVDRIFATDSHSMYFLTWPEMVLMQSTPYVEEMTYSRCGKSRRESMSRENNWTMREDPQHVDCYRRILKELMAEGAKKYLAEYIGGALPQRETYTQESVERYKACLTLATTLEYLTTGYCEYKGTRYYPDGRSERVQ